MLSDPGLVSVIIPAYNAESTLRTAVDSVLSQTYGQTEIIVIDDGSTDGTADVISSFGSAVQGVFQANNGVSTARNRGIDLASGSFISFLDADDSWHPDKLAKQTALLARRPEVMGTYVGVSKVSPEGTLIENVEARSFDDLCRSLLLYSSVIPSSPSSLLLRRQAVEIVGGFDPNFSQCADWDLLLRASTTIRLAPVNEYLVRYLVWSDNMSKNIPLLERDTFAVLDKFYASQAADKYTEIKKRVYSNHWLILSGSYLHAGEVRQSLRCLREALRTDPANVRYPLALPSRWLRRSTKRG